MISKPYGDCFDSWYKSYKHIRMVDLKVYKRELADAKVKTARTSEGISIPFHQGVKIRHEPEGESTVIGCPKKACSYRHAIVKMCVSPTHNVCAEAESSS